MIEKYLAIQLISQQKNIVVGKMVLRAYFCAPNLKIQFILCVEIAQ